MGARISTDWTYKGMRALVLENDDLRATVLVDYGAKVLEFRLKSMNRDLLYHNPRVEIRTPVYGVNMDREEIVRETKECLRAAAPGGGYMLSSSNSWYTGARFENCLAMVDAGRKYGRYPISMLD